MASHPAAFGTEPRFALSRLFIAVGLAWSGSSTGGMAFAQTPNADAQTLPAVTVKAQVPALDEAPAALPGGQVASGTRMGILGNVPVMDTPFSVTGYTAETIQNEQARSVADVLVADPSVRPGAARSGINEDFTIRGFNVPGADFAFNGLFGLAPYWRMPTEALERVELIKGPSAALFGMTPGGSIGGVVNLVPKRAGDDPLTRFTLGAMSDSVLSGHLDIGRRFGQDKAFGVRVNAMARSGDTPLDGQSVRDNLGSVALDYRGRGFRASLDLMHNKQRIDNVVRQFSVGGALTAIPAAPDGSKTYPGFGYTDGQDRMALLKGEYDLSRNITAFAAFGKRKQEWDAIAANPTLNDSAGNYTAAGGWQRQNTDSKSMEAGLRGVFNTGGVSHNATLAWTRLDQQQQLGFLTTLPGTTVASNIYAGTLFPTPSTAGFANPLNRYLDVKLTSVALADTIGFMQDRLLLTAGLRRQQVEAQNYNFATGAPSGAYYDKSATTPLAGIVYKLQPNLSLYASYVEGLSRGDTAPVAVFPAPGGVTNPGEMLAPYKSKQKEVGVKWARGTLLAGLSFFEITKPSSGIVNNTFSVVGEQRNRGMELSAAGQASKTVRVLGGVTVYDAELSKSATPALVGNKPVGVPDWQANLGSEWEMLPGLSLSGRYIYTGASYVNNSNTLKAQGWNRVDAGLRYVTQMAGKPVTFRLNVENLLDKNYWNVNQSGGYLVVGSPRTAMMSVTFDM